MKKFLKNKKIFIAIIVILLSGLYIIANKSIKNYNNDIITEENTSSDLSEEEMNVVTEDENDTKDNGESGEENADFQDEDESRTNQEQVSEDAEKIYVYVTGQVNIPGVVILDKGSRIADAISAAGGTTSKANTTKINLVYVLEDGMKVNIPSNDDLKKDSSFEYITKDSGEGAGDANNLSADNGTSSNTKKERASSIVNINTATQTELETLPGIGPSTALKIINYRKENGKFSSIEDLKNVNGIGDNKFEALKKYITV